MNSTAFQLSKPVLEQLFEQMVTFRRTLHQNPELSMKEFQTHDFILKTLESAGFKEIHKNIAGTGLVAVLRGQIDESILLRADSDALPIQENNSLQFKSQNPGVMHACGHDGHVAMLLATAIHLQNAVKQGLVLQRGIKFCFQPGEEGANGAGQMVADASAYNLLEASPRVVHCFGFHLSAQLEVGVIGYSAGLVLSNSQQWTIEVVGKGGHSMAPEETVDALQIGSLINIAIYQIRGRNVNQANPCCLSIGSFHSGSAPNVISDKATITGTMRTYTQEDADSILERMEKICRGTALQYNCQVNLEVKDGYKSVLNHPSLEPAIINAINRVAKHQPTPPSLAGEDFYQFSDRKPSAYLVIGAALPGTVTDGKSTKPHHSPQFDFDERGMQTGLQTWLSIVQEFQQGR